MAGPQALGIQHQRVEYAVGIFAFLGDELPALLQLLAPGPGHGTERHLPALGGGEAVIGRVVEIQLTSGDGIGRKPLGGGEVPQRIGLQHLDGGNGLAHKGFQPFPVQAVAGEGAEPAVYEEGQLQAAVQGVGYLVHLAVQDADQVQEAFVQGDAHLAGPLG